MVADVSGCRSSCRQRVGLRLALLAGVALLIGGAGEARAATESCPFGVNAHQSSNHALDLAAAAGIGWVRFDMSWSQFEPQQGQYVWTEADRFIDHATSVGLHVFVTIAYSPAWAVAQPCNEADPNPVNQCHNRPPVSVADWTGFITAAVGRYQGKVSHWGMWNEPNLLGFFNGSRDQYVSEILIPGGDAVHAACPGCKVLGPELANLRGANWDSDQGVCVGNNCAFNGWNYSLKKILEVATGNIDIITHHKYAAPASVFWPQAVDGEFIGTIQIINGIKELTDQLAPGKPVWITEFGMQSEPFGSHSNSETATELEAYYLGFDAIRAGSYVGAVNQPWPELVKLFWYDLVNDPNGYSWGLLNADETTKPPYDAYANVIQTLGPCDGSGGGAGGAGGGSSSGSGGASSASSGSGGAAAGGGTGGASSASSGSGGSGAAASGAGGAGDEEGGCGCSLPGDGSASGRALGLAALLMLALADRRRRRPQGRSAGRSLGC